MEFTHKEWEAFGIKDLQSNYVVKVDNEYFKPLAVPKIEIVRLFGPQNTVRFKVRTPYYSYTSDWIIPNNTDHTSYAHAICGQSIQKSPLPTNCTDITVDTVWKFYQTSRQVENLKNNLLSMTGKERVDDLEKEMRENRKTAVQDADVKIPKIEYDPFKDFPHIGNEKERVNRLATHYKTWGFSNAT